LNWQSQRQLLQTLTRILHPTFLPILLLKKEKNGEGGIPSPPARIAAPPPKPAALSFFRLNSGVRVGFESHK
jgi:hypothetical protein